MFSFLSRFKHQQEMRESKDEILIGEMVLAMQRLGAPAIGFRADAGLQYVRYKPISDPVLNSVVLTLDQNIFKMPLLGEIRLDHQLNSVLATKKVIIDIDQYILNPEAQTRLYNLLGSTIHELREALRRYKK